MNNREGRIDSMISICRVTHQVSISRVYSEMYSECGPLHFDHSETQCCWNVPFHNSECHTMGCPEHALAALTAKCKGFGLVGDLKGFDIKTFVNCVVSIKY